MISALSGPGEGSIDHLFGQLIEAKSDESFSTLSQKILVVANTFKGMQKIGAKNLLLQIQTDRRVESLGGDSAGSAEKADLQRVKAQSQKIDNLHTRMYVAVTTPRSSASTTLKILQSEMDKDAQELARMTALLTKAPTIKSLGKALSENLQALSIEDVREMCKPQVTLQRPWEKKDFFSPDEQKIFNAIKMSAGSADEFDRKILSEGVAPSKILINARFSESGRDPENHELIAYYNSIADDLVIDQDAFLMAITSIDSRVNLEYKDASLTFFIRDTPGVDAASVSGLPNRSVDCFFNSALQLLAQDYAEKFNPETNPIKLELFAAHMDDRDRTRYMSAGITRTAEVTEGNNKLIQAHLSLIQGDMYSIMDKVNNGREVSPAEIGSLRAKLHAIGIIEVGDLVQEDASLVKGRIFDRILEFTDGASTYQVESERTSEIYARDINEEDRELLTVLPEGATLYVESPDDPGVFRISPKIEKTPEYGSGISKDPLWSPVGSSTDYIPVGNDRYYLQTADGKYYHTKAAKVRKLHTVERILSAGDVLSIRLGRVPPHEAKAFGLDANISLNVPPEITVGGKKYALSGYLSHVGRSSGSGHYIANRLVRDAEGFGRWNLCNDSSTYAYGQLVGKGKGQAPGGPGFGGDSYKPEELLSNSSSSLQYVRVKT